MPEYKNPTVLSEFKDYAYFSERFDQYFNVINIYGMHHEAIKQIHKALPSREKIKTLLASDIDEDAKRFLVISSGALGYMATTNIFNSEADQVSDDIPKMP